MNALSNALYEIHSQIPFEILQEVFGKEHYLNWRREAPVSLDEMIRSKVLRPRLLKDCNLLGGRRITISLEGLPYSEQDSLTFAYTIPLERTNNQEIISVLAVGYLSNALAGIGIGSYAAAGPFTASDVLTAGQRVMDSFANTPHVSTASAELIGYNTVIIRDSGRPVQAMQLQCIIANEENLNNISPRSWRQLAIAAVMATKAYIYNNLNVRMNRGMLEQGQELGVFREIVQEYRDSQGNYDDYLKNTLQKVLFMSDQKSFEHFLRLQINPGV